MVTACDSRSALVEQTEPEPAAGQSLLENNPRGDSVSRFALYAEHSIKLGRGDRIRGGAVGIHARTGPGAGAQLELGEFARIEGRTVIAPSVELKRGSMVGRVEADSLDNDGGVLEGVSPFPSTTPSLPLALAPTPGSTNVRIEPFEEQTLAPGAYGALDVAGTVRLEPGIYSFSQVMLTEGARFLATGARDEIVDVRVRGSFHAGPSTTIATERASAKKLVISVSGRDASPGVAASIGENSILRCLLTAPRGTLVVHEHVNATGALAAFDIRVARDARVTWQGGFRSNVPTQTGKQTLSVGYASPPFSNAPVVSPAPSDLPVSLAIGLPVVDVKGLRAMVAQVSNRTSPQYRHYLSQDEFTARFGPSSQNYATLQAWATGVGLTTRATVPNNMVLAVSAPASVVEQALHLNLNYALRPNGSQFIMPDRDPSLDPDTQVLSIQGLDDYYSKSTALSGDDYRHAYALPVRPSDMCPTPGLGSTQVIGILSPDQFLPSDIDWFKASDPEYDSGGNLTVTPISADGTSPAPPTFECSCDSPFVSCNGSCVDVQTDVNNCGACNTRCGDSLVCASGACQASCPQGTTNCGGSCISGSSCAPSCPLGADLCGGSCKDLNRDPNNCGSCGTTCGTGLGCVNGQCATNCPIGYSTCGGTCVSLTANPANCGGCGNLCSPNTECVAFDPDGQHKLQDIGEITYDIQMALSMAPRATVDVFLGSNFNAQLAKATTQLPRPNQLSTSYGFCKDDTAQQLLWEAALQGQSFFAPSGDYGALTMSSGHSCLLDGVTYVGGTVLTPLTSGTASWSETSWVTPGCADKDCSGGGIIPDDPIPDYQAAFYATPVGMATLALNQGDSMHRNLPDVSMVATNESGFAENTPNSSGGTSMSAPMWAGFVALINDMGQRANPVVPPVGFINPAIYAIGVAGSQPPFGNCQPNTFFNDICDNANNAGPFNPVGFNAVAGYDLVTGWGSPKCELMGELACPTVCGGMCARLDRDPVNCGTCGNVCPAACVAGICAPPSVSVRLSGVSFATSGTNLFNCANPSESATSQTIQNTDVDGNVVIPCAVVVQADGSLSPVTQTAMRKVGCDTVNNTGAWFFVSCEGTGQAGDHHIKGTVSAILSSDCISSTNPNPEQISSLNFELDPSNLTTVTGPVSACANFNNVCASSTTTCLFNHVTGNAAVTFGT